VRIIYYSYWGTYAAYTMAALHTGIYPADCMPPQEFISAQYELCRKFGDQTGNLLYVGLDDQLREVYSLGCCKHSDVVIRAVENINLVFEIRDSIIWFSAEKLDRGLPSLLQRLKLYKNDCMEKLFYIWFKESYQKCRQEVLHTKESLRDGIIL